MANKKLLRSFAGGEISPQLFARADLDKYQTGLSLCENAWVMPQGPIQNRPGFSYVLGTRYNGFSSRLIPFSFNTEQTFALEFGNGYIRFHSQGGTLLENAIGVSAVAGNTFTTSGAHGYNAGQWVYLTGMNGLADTSNIWGVVATTPSSTTFTLNDLFGNPLAPVGAYTGGGNVARVYEVVTPYDQALLYSLNYVQSADVMTIVSPDYAPMELRRLGATNWQLTTIVFASSLSAPTGVTATATGTGTTSYSYVVTARDDAGTEESVASAAATVTNDLTTSGNKNTITWTPITGIQFYSVYKLTNGIYGFIGSAGADGSFVDNYITADVSQTPPLQLNPFVGVGNYPRAVTYHEQRRVFGGTVNQPQTLWMTRSGTERNLSYSYPSRADDSIVVRVVSREANTIRHLVPMNALILLSSGGEWKIDSSDGGALTPQTISVRQQGYNGSTKVLPLLTSQTILFAQDRGGHIRELQYSWQAQSYQTTDVSILAPHLFDYHAVKQMCFSRSPLQLVWSVRDDGLLLGMTYVTEHDVRAWHRHITDGAFESCCAIAEGDEDVLYVIVRRVIRGQTVRYVERLHTRRFDTAADQFFVDSGLTYTGAAVSQVGGLQHLEGKTVAILADGGVSPPQVVTGGKVALDGPATKVHVGLPYVSRGMTLPFSAEVEALGQGINKNVNKVMLRVQQSNGFEAGSDFDHMSPVRTRGDEPYGSAPDLITGSPEISISGHWTDDGQVCFRQAQPLSFMLLSLVLDVSVGG